MLDIWGFSKGNVGIVKTNKEHRRNLLTPRFVKQVYRGVTSMYIDDQIQVVFLSSAKGEHFSAGTDFKTILHYKETHQEHKIASYLEDIFKLQATVAKMNKPLLSIAPGHTFNSAASLLAASGMPAVCHNTLMAFNECSFGFVPHAGTTYFASRMPGELGTFLVLTGIPFTGEDAINMRLAEKMVQIPQTYENEVAEVFKAFDYPTHMSHFNSLELDRR
jgi:enoyl-CoA hydratase/carnithine racemase